MAPNEATIALLAKTPWANVVGGAKTATGTTALTRPPRTFTNPNDRLKSKLAKKNWQTVMNVAVVKEKMNESSAAGFNPPYDNIYATSKENWTYFSIILFVVTFLSIVICFLVYLFFHKFRT